MTHASPEVLACTGDYGPHILDCGRFDGTAAALRIGPEHDADLPSQAYRLVRLLEGAGSCQLGEDRWRCHDDAVLLWQPGVIGELHLPERAVAIQAAFDVVPQPRTSPGERRRSRHQGPDLQPGPRRVWGIDLPTLVTGPSAASAAALLVRLASTYWRDPLSHYLANAELAAWLADLVARTAGREPIHPGLATADPMHVARQLASDALSHRLPTDDLARASGLGRSTFFQRFRAETGAGPAGWLRERRLDRACELLAGSDLPISQIGRIVGYRNAAAFSRAFKRQIGCTPRQWRRRGAGPPLAE